jgi:hypothetical protein
MDQAEHHQWELEQQMEWQEYRHKRDGIQGRLLGCIDLLKAAKEAKSEERIAAAIADLMYYHDLLDTLKKHYWGK